jgi:DNA-directed RNA polymerase subunit RPC12/RpoP
MQTQTLMQGEWYHSVDCSHCGALVHAFHARAGSDERLPGPGLFSVRCPKCAYRDLYKPNAFTARRYGVENDIVAAH